MKTKPKRFTVKEYAKELKASNAPLVGYLVWYNLSGRVLHTAFQKAFAASGLPSGYEIKPVQPWQAFRRATRQFERATAGEGFADLFEDDADTAKVALVARDDSEKDNDKINYAHETTILLDKQTGSLDIRGVFLTDVFKKLYKENREYHNHTDIRRIVIDYLNEKCQAHSVRDHGGIYFVPNTFIGEIARLKVFLDRLGNNSHFYTLPVADTKQARVEVKKSFAEQMEAEIVRFHEELAKVAENRYHTSAMQKKLDEFNKLRTKVSAYQDLLKYKAKDSIKAITMLEKKVKKLIDKGIERDVETKEAQRERRKEKARERRAEEKKEKKKKSKKSKKSSKKKSDKKKKSTKKKDSKKKKKKKK